ncbi:hypothetical protein DAI22_04g159200 [Oryza sativa Japonica Group]|nr:hypothetical protein DAI22_04g159200 [Oryza sativa Japonica Group]
MITWRAWLVGLVADCVGACDARCSEHSHKKRCSRSCLTCCSACRCVPAGTAGNRETCGRCYTDWVSHNNMTKCP